MKLGKSMTRSEYNGFYIETTMMHVHYNVKHYVHKRIEDIILYKLIPNMLDNSIYNHITWY